MCGLIGFIDYGKKIKLAALDRATDQMYLRGPEARGTVLLEETMFNIGLGHRRLAILDLDERSNQPYIDEGIHIVFNGEIYNFQVLKEELFLLGHTFKTASDTEVIIKAYIQWGDKCFSMFIGMFAICIYDKNKNEMTLVRDRLGVKPLYFYQNSGTLIFGSETKALITLVEKKLKIDKAALHGYFSLGYIPGEHSIYEGIKKIKQGTITKINLNNFQQIKSNKYWDIIDYTSLGLYSETDKSDLEKLLFDAVKLRLVADVEVGSFLSGGLDSSYITKVISEIKNKDKEKVKSFTIGFKASFDEAPHAHKVANFIGTDHVTYYLKPEDVSDIIYNYADYFDDPFSDDAAIPMLYLSKKSMSSVKVVISSDGGDELFAGYGRYENAISVNKKLSLIPSFCRGVLKIIAEKLYAVLPKKSKYSIFFWRLKYIIHANNNVQLANILFFGDSIPKPELSKLISDTILNEAYSHNYFANTDKNISNIKQLLAIDINERLVNQMLIKVDKSTMGASIEGREPLLDHRLFEFMFSKPDSYFINNGIKKHLFKKVVFDKFSDKKILNKPKMGFNTPVLKWLKEYYADFVEEEINSVEIFKIPYLKIENLRIFWEEYKNGNVHYQQLLWRIIIYIGWYKKQFLNNKV